VKEIYVIATLGSSGDLHPFLAVARALLKRGKQVLFLSQEPYRTEVEAEGVPFQAIASQENHSQTQNHPFLWHPIRGFGVLWRYLVIPAIDPTFTILENLCREPNTRVKVFASPLVIGARLAREILPLHLSTGHTAPAGLRSCSHPMFLGSWQVPRWFPNHWRRMLWHVLDRYKLEPMAAPKLNAWRMAHQLQPLQEHIFQRWIHSPDQVIGMFPANFGVMPNDWPVKVQLTGFPLYESSVSPTYDQTLDTFCQSLTDLPLIVFFPGSAAQGRHAVMQAAATALAQSGQFRCLWIGQEENVISPSLLHRKWVKLPQVLPWATVFVHHGGIGSCAQGLVAGVKQLILPAAYDQFDNGARITAMREGIWLAPAHQNPSSVQTAILHWSQQPKKIAQPSVQTAYSHNQFSIQSAVQAICQQLEQY